MQIHASQKSWSCSSERTWGVKIGDVSVCSWVHFVAWVKSCCTSTPLDTRKYRNDKTTPFQVPCMIIGVSKFRDLTYENPSKMPRAVSCGKSRVLKWQAAKPSALTTTAA